LQKFLNDVMTIQTDVKLPQILNRRDVGDRFACEVDDIFTIFACLDENNLIDKLPKCVCSGLDFMPPMQSIVRRRFTTDHGYD